MSLKRIAQICNRNFHSENKSTEAAAAVVVVVGVVGSFAHKALWR
jgi:hypothetical protein